MNIENLEAFVYVVHFGSFNKAAEALYLSQPSVTARIQSLERELDCMLLIRTGKQVHLSEQGKQFLPYAQQMLQIYQKGKLQIQKPNSFRQELRIGCTISVSNYVIPELITRLKERFAKQTFKLTTASTEAILEKVLNRELDIGFVRNVTHPQIQSIKFFEDPIRLYVHADHPFVGNERVTIEAISHQPLVFYECGALDWLRIHRVFENLDQPPSIEIQTDHSETAKQLVLNRVGISFLPSLCVHQEVLEGRLYAIEFPETKDITLKTNVIALNGEHTELLEFLSDIGKAFRLAKQR